MARQIAPGYRLVHRPGAQRCADRPFWKHVLEMRPFHIGKADFQNVLAAGFHGRRIFEGRSRKGQPFLASVVGHFVATRLCSPYMNHENGPCNRQSGLASAAPLLLTFDQMPSNFEQAFDRVKQLAADFQGNDHFYLSPAYQEAEARRDFIDKFLIALGWDVNHDTQKEKFAKFYCLVSRLAVTAGSLEKYAETLPTKPGTSRRGRSTRCWQSI